MKCNNPYMLPSGVSVPCGQCLACKISRTREWAVRMIHEFFYWDKAVFLTLTYDDEHLFYYEYPSTDIYSDYASISKDEMQRFFKRVRKCFNKKIKYFCCGEYGERTFRPHYHAIVFGLETKDRPILQDLWNRGMVHAGTVTIDSCRYVAGYLDKKYNNALEFFTYTCYGLNSPFQLCSQAFGLEWCYDNELQLSDNLFTHFKGKKIPLPRYYREKLKLNGVQKAKMKEFAKDLRLGDDCRIMNKGVKPDDVDKYRLSEKKQGEAELRERNKIVKRGRL